MQNICRVQETRQDESNSIKKCAKRWTDFFYHHYYLKDEIQQTQEKLFMITSHWWSVNQNHSRVLSHSRQNGYHLKKILAIIWRKSCPNTLLVEMWKTIWTLVRNLKANLPLTQRLWESTWRKWNQHMNDLSLPLYFQMSIIC